MALPSSSQICMPDISNAAPLLRFQISTTPHLINWSGPTRDPRRSNLRLAEAPILVPPFVRTSVSTISQLLLIDSHCGSDIYVSAADLSASTSDCPRDGNSGVSEKGYSSNVCLRSLHSPIEILARSNLRVWQGERWGPDPWSAPCSSPMRYTPNLTDQLQDRCQDLSTGVRTRRSWPSPASLPSCY